MEYKETKNLSEVEQMGKVTDTMKCDDDDIIVTDSANVEFNPEIHQGDDIFTNKGKFKKIPKSQRKLETKSSQDTINVSSDFFLEMSKSLGAGLSGNPDFKHKKFKQLDKLFKKTLDDKFADDDIANSIENKVPYLILLGVPLFYIFNGLKENENLSSKIKRNVFFVLGYSFSKIKSIFKRK